MPHRVSDQMGALAIEIIDHCDDIARPRLLMIESGIGRLVAQPVAERVNARDAVSLAQRADEAGLLPGPAIHQHAVLQHDQLPLALYRVMNSSSAMNGKRHVTSPSPGTMRQA